MDVNGVELNYGIIPCVLGKFKGEGVVHKRTETSPASKILEGTIRQGLA